MCIATCTCLILHCTLLTAHSIQLEHYQPNVCNLPIHFQPQHQIITNDEWSFWSGLVIPSPCELEVTCRCPGQPTLIPAWQQCWVPDLTRNTSRCRDIFSPLLTPQLNIDLVLSSLEYTAPYAGLLLAPAEGFVGLRPKTFFALQKMGSCLAFL